VAATGWTVDYVRQRLDLPTVRALYAAWSEAPPPGLQLSRIEAYLKAALGIKDGPRRAADRSRSAPSAEEEDWLAGLPERPLPKYLTPDEYWAMREAERLAGAKHE